MSFNKIACVDNPGFPDSFFPLLQFYSKAKIIPETNYPQSDKEIIANIGDADCALVSWNTVINKSVINACPNLKYIGMCCSLIDEDSANVDISAAKDKGIVVKGIRDYGDEGVIEYILSELIQLLKGLGKYQWKEDQLELGGQKIGIIGMGTTGQMLAETALHFRMNVHYYSRSRNPFMEDKGCKYLPLNELLDYCDIISMHLPKNLQLLNASHFKQFGSGKILINTSLGLNFNPQDFTRWLYSPVNYSIMDKSGMGIHAEELSALEGMLSTRKTTGFTKEAKHRLGQKVVNNIIEYLK